MINTEKINSVKRILLDSTSVQLILQGVKTTVRKPLSEHQLGTWRDYQKQRFELKNRVSPISLPTITEDAFYESYSPYNVGDILRVSEAWDKIDSYKAQSTYIYKADELQNKLLEESGFTPNWKSSTSMPKDATRIFLSVVNIKLEHLQDIQYSSPGPENDIVKEGFKYLTNFIAAWDNSLPPRRQYIHNWDSNPYVWVIEFKKLDSSYMRVVNESGS